MPSPTKTRPPSKPLAELRTKATPRKRHGPVTSASRITDPRFSNFETDPRFRIPSSRRSRTTLDKRFAHMLKDDEFTSTARIDRYGRKLDPKAKKKALMRLYQSAEEDEDEDEDDKGLRVERDGDIVRKELRKAQAKYDPARGGGFSSSEPETESDDDDEEANDERADMQRFQDQRVTSEMGDVTNRLAIVNIDWDHIKSTDLMAIFSSFVPAAGQIQKVSIYPSEFGKERIQREELEGPPKELFQPSAKDKDKRKKSHDDGDAADGSDEETKKELIQECDDEDFDSDVLRAYQLDRLRYYYAIMVCSDKVTAKSIYDATDGTEYLSSANFLDLRFVPDDVTFYDEPRDECTEVPANYKPVEFMTDALQHSKVKLTWDMHPEEVTRQDSIKKAFSGSRAEIAENDLRAYLASDSEGDEVTEAQTQAKAGHVEQPKPSKELERQRLRQALGLSDEPAAKKAKDGPVGGLRITFRPALTGDENKTATEELTIEKYKRKEKERKAKRKEKALQKRGGAEVAAEACGEDKAEQEDLGFDDPFFNTYEPSKETKSAPRKAERRAKREAKEVEATAKAAEKAQLELLMMENTGEHADHLEHFDMNAIERQEKQKRKKKKSKMEAASAEQDGELQQDFQMDVGDSRFSAVFDSHDFSIDPSHPKFKATKGMRKLLEAGRSKRKARESDSGDPGAKSSKKVKPAQGSIELSGLVDVVKKKVQIRS